MKLLLTEDDAQLGEALQALLVTHGYAVTWVRCAEDAQRFIQGENFDLLLIDIVLPRMSGLDLLRWTRDRATESAIMMLTARDSVFDRVLGLDAGADDYLRISRMSVLKFTTCQANISCDVGPSFHGMSVQVDAGRRIVSESSFGVNGCRG
jgi:CheY-like chemotaxis protein